MQKLLIACFVLSTALFYNWLQESDMPKSQEQAPKVDSDMLNSFKAQQKSAFILGYTGEVGKELTRAVVQSGVFKRVVLMGRRIVDYSNDSLLKDVEQVKIDFDKIDEYADAFKNMDVGYCCLGTTRSKHGVDEFIKVDHDYVVNTARVAKNAGVAQYQLVTSVGSDENSWFLYPKTKGRAEQGLIKLGFERLTIMRPGFLICDRVEHRPLEKVASAVMSPVIKMAPTRFSAPTRTVGLAMLYRTIVPPKDPVDIVENARIHELAANLPGFDSAK